MGQDNKKKLNILIATIEPFPKGMANTNRITSYAKGMVELGHSVTIHCVKPTEQVGRQILNKDTKGTYHGIQYEYTAGTTIWPPHGKERLKKMFLLFTGLKNSIRLILKYKKTRGIDGIIMNYHDVEDILAYKLLTVFLGIPLVYEISEFPFAISRLAKYRKNMPGRLYSNLYVNTVYKLFDGMIIMTYPLMEYFKKLTHKKSILVHVPMTVDYSRFEKNYPDAEKKYIAYAGAMGGNKDGVDILIRAFDLISKDYSDYYLYLIGDAPEADMTKLKNLAARSESSDKIVFTGRVDNFEVPKIIMQAQILALARPSSLQATGGFPTKLGEYLATGNPAVVTKVGDIPKYFKDGENAFISEPDSVEAFAEKMRFVIDNPDIAQQVGINGKKLVYEFFNYKKQAQAISNLFYQLKLLSANTN